MESRKKKDAFESKRPIEVKDIAESIFRCNKENTVQNQVVQMRPITERNIHPRA